MIAHGFDGVSTSGGRGGLGFAGGEPGGGLTSTGGGKGAACWPTTGDEAGACGATALGDRWRGSWPGSGASIGWPGRSVCGIAGDGNAAVDGGNDGGSTGGGSPRSMASSRRVSRSMVRTASQDDSEVTSSTGLSASGVPVANTWISGRLLVEPIELSERLARTSA